MSKRTGKTIPTYNRWRSLKLPVLVYPFLGLLILLGSCGFAQAQGWWQATGQSTVTGQPVGVTGTNPAEIRGSWTIRQVLDTYKINQADLFAAFKIPAGISPDAKLNTLESVAPGFSVEALRTWVGTKLKGS
jgi:hypothetical protein